MPPVECGPCCGREGCVVVPGGLLSRSWGGDVYYYRQIGQHIVDGLMPYHQFYLEYPPGALAVLSSLGERASCALVHRLLEARGLRVTTVLVTHTHNDHIEGVGELVARTGAAVVVSAREADRVRRDGLGRSCPPRPGERATAANGGRGHAADRRRMVLAGDSHERWRGDRARGTRAVHGRVPAGRAGPG